MTGKGRKPTRRSGRPPETRINVRGSDNAIASGPKSFAANVRIIFQDNWRPFAVILIIVAVLLAAVLYFVIPKKAAQFSKQFNVAVAEFVVEDENGNPLHTKDGYNLAVSTTDQLKTGLNELQLDKSAPSYEIWGPEQTGVIKNDQDAESFARSTRATVVIYGTIKKTGSISFFTPQFYVNHSAFKEADEITGEHELGSNVEVNLNAEMSLTENPGLQARVEGMSMLTIGLVYYSVDKFENALAYFQKADNSGWVGSGKETVYLLIGNVYVRQASKTKDFSALPSAEQKYKAALDLNPNYGRAMIGDANVLYLRAHTQDNCDPTGLDAASALLDQASTLKDQPASANIETKVHFYRGQIALIRDDCHLPGGDWRAIADQEFTWLIQRYESNPQSEVSQSIQYLASHSYARLSYLAYQRNDANAAIAFLQKAIPISSPDWKGAYTANLGDIYAAIGQKDKAREAYQQAIAIAIGNADADSAATYQQKLNSVSGP
jgi:tetratricopeptide (TPR) repeat protein